MTSKSTLAWKRQWRLKIQIVFHNVEGPRSRADLAAKESRGTGSRALLELREAAERDRLLATYGLLRMSDIFRLMSSRGAVQGLFDPADEKWQVGAGIPDVKCILRSCGRVRLMSPEVKI